MAEKKKREEEMKTEEDVKITDGKAKSSPLIDTFTLQKGEYTIHVKLYKTGVSVTAYKDLLWYTGALESVDEEDLQLAAESLKKGEIDMIAKDASNVKVIVKGLQSIKLTLDTHTPSHEKEIVVLKKEVAGLKREIETIKSAIPGGIVNVTVHVDNVRRAYKAGDPHVVAFTVDKKQAATILLVQANICAHGEGNSETAQYWKYGDRTIAAGQTENYHNNSGHGRSVPSMAVIAGHVQTGPQELKLYWKPSYTPFTILNPNKTDHGQYEDGQTCSVYTVWEILQ